MNSNPSVGSSRSPERTRPRLFQDLSLFAQRLHFAAKSSQLIAFVGRQTIGAHALIGIRLGYPIPDRLRSRLKLLRQPLWCSTRSNSLYQPPAKLIGVRGS
jgi:hypothetical protein